MELKLQDALRAVREGKTETSVYLQSASQWLAQLVHGTETLVAG
jgi:hypothetical protein